MSDNVDKSKAPEWVDSNFLKEVLEYDGNFKNLIINDFHIFSSSALGDHFASIMFRVNITFSAQDHPSEKCSIIIKTLPIVEGFKKDALDKTNIDLFGTEIFMYSKVLTECRKILKSAGYNDLLAARMIYQSTEPHKVIVFEDLSELGYIMFPRTIPNEADTALIFSKLGQYHAATFKLAAEGHKALKLKGGVFNFGDIDMFNYFREPYSFFTVLVETLSGFEEASEKLAKVSFDKIVKNCIQIVNAPGSYEVLNHGDYHIKNMMFKGTNETAISEIVLVDFQICHWGSPAFDLAYMSAIIPPRIRPQAYKHYFDVFIDVLEKSGYKGLLPTFEQLQKDLKSYRILDLYFLGTNSPVLCADKDQLKDEMETLFKNPSLFKVLYSQPTYISYVKELLTVLLQEGFLDDLINSD
ncbi:unnamed protein product [Hermetia illucens]|uniref:CHK kinase-like domain-containing protein n=1 Tax=Hermetia illucens TaxID=343691 RepID=A0A7R8V7W7_HERIL|nr:unnamed protein product [Hermetia illucens]